MAPRRARLSVAEHELGSWWRARRAPDPRLRGVVAGELIGYRHAATRFDGWLEPARPELTLMIDLDGWISADGERLPAAWIGGLADRPVHVGVGETYASIDVKLHPLGAYRLLGLPLSELGGGCVPVADVLGAPAAALVERLRTLSDWDARFDVLEAFLAGRLADAPEVEPAVAWAWQRLHDSEGRMRIETLAAEIGCSRRYLSRRFGEQVGLSPKTMARVLRFRGVRRRIERDPPAWARIAADAGYADQPHLNREFLALAGISPGEMIARLMPGGGLRGGSGDGTIRPRRDAIWRLPWRAHNHRGDHMSFHIIPAVRYRDADAGIRFLLEAFGAEEQAIHRDDAGVIRHAELRLGDGLVMVGQYAPDGWLGGEAPRPLSSTVSLYVVVEDPDAHHARASGVGGARVVRELQDTDYGSREYSVRDPEGNPLSFGTYDPLRT